MVVTPSFEMSGSMLAGTAAHRLVGISTSVAIESAEPADTVAALVDQAERMCFVLDALERPHEVTRSFTLNGAPLVDGAYQ